MRPKSDAQELLDMLAGEAVRRLEAICWRTTRISLFTLGCYAAIALLFEVPGALGGGLLLGSACGGVLAFFWGQYLLVVIHEERGTFGRNRFEVRMLLTMIALWQKEIGIGDIIEADKKRYEDQLKEAIIRARIEADVTGAPSKDGPC